jgi:hypothetical protein
VIAISRSLLGDGKGNKEKEQPQAFVDERTWAKYQIFYTIQLTARLKVPPQNPDLFSSNPKSSARVAVLVQHELAKRSCSPGESAMTKSVKGLIGFRPAASGSDPKKRRFPLACDT